MTFAECEILADAACHLKAIGSRMRDPENVREISYVLGMLATLPLVSEAAEARRCSSLRRAWLPRRSRAV